MTLFDPVTLPMASSAYFEFLAAIIDANVSGNEVPRATNEIAVILSFNPTKHPKIAATSPTTAVRMAIKSKETKKVSQPPRSDVGGTKAKRT